MQGRAFSFNRVSFAEQVLGRGGNVASSGQVGASYPSSQTAVTVTNRGGLGTVTAYAICASAL